MQQFNLEVFYAWTRVIVEFVLVDFRTQLIVQMLTRTPLIVQMLYHADQNTADGVDAKPR